MLGLVCEHLLESRRGEELAGSPSARESDFGDCQVEAVFFHYVLHIWRRRRRTIVTVRLGQVQLPFLDGFELRKFRARLRKPNRRVRTRLPVHIDMHAMIAVGSIPDAVLFPVHVGLRSIRKGIRDCLADKIGLVTVKDRASFSKSGLIL